jgi:hypothetical protein
MNWKILRYANTDMNICNSLFSYKLHYIRITRFRCFLYTWRWISINDGWKDLFRFRRVVLRRVCCFAQLLLRLHSIASAALFLHIISLKHAGMIDFIVWLKKNMEAASTITQNNAIIKEYSLNGTIVSNCSRFIIKTKFVPFFLMA